MWIRFQGDLTVPSTHAPYVERRRLAEATKVGTNASHGNPNAPTHMHIEMYSSHTHRIMATYMHAKKHVDKHYHLYMLMKYENTLGAYTPAHACPFFDTHVQEKKTQKTYAESTCLSTKQRDSWC